MYMRGDLNGRYMSARLVALALGLTLAPGVWSQQVSAVSSHVSFPSIGDRWVYEARDVDHPSRKNQIVVEIREVTPSSITDVSAFKPRRNPEITQTHEAGAYLMAIAPGVADFSPYLLAFQKLQGGESWPEVKFEYLWACNRMEMVQCNASARVVGKESVSVRAGTFEAWKIVVRLRLWMGASATGFGELIYWLAEESKRVVKYQSRVKFAVGGHYSWPEPDVDMELLSYTPIGTAK